MSLRHSAYQLALKGMFTLRPERIHGIIADGLGLLQAAGPVNRLLGKVIPVTDPVLSQEVFGVTFPRPLGLAAGFDKNASAADTWTSLGFGYSELGTVTASPQPGNPTPRLFRLPADKAILNRMGFNNEGAAAAAENLRRRKSQDVIGNVARVTVDRQDEGRARRGGRRRLPTLRLTARRPRRLPGGQRLLPQHPGPA